MPQGRCPTPSSGSWRIPRANCTCSRASLSSVVFRWQCTSRATPSSGTGVPGRRRPSLPVAASRPNGSGRCGSWGSPRYLPTAQRRKVEWSGPMASRQWYGLVVELRPRPVGALLRRRTGSSGSSYPATAISMRRDRGLAGIGISTGRPGAGPGWRALHQGAAESGEG
jgi:hypothetical protein